MESTSKGFLAPRVALNDVNSAAPLAAAVPEGMLVYSSGGAVTNGYYFWNGTKWKAITPTATGTMGNQPYASFSSSTNQFVVSTTTSKLITYETDEILNLITHSTTINPSRFTIQEDGIYLLTFSAELHGATADIDIWLRQNGVDVPRSNSRSSLQSANDYRLLVVTFIVSAVANDYFELVQSSTSTSGRLAAIGTGTNPTRPSIPSIIVTINKISD